MAVLNPLTDLPWNIAYWTEGPEFIAQGYGNGSSVGLFPDEIGTVDSVQATSSKKPIFLTNGFNGRPALVGDGVDDYLTAASGGISGKPHARIVIGRMISLPPSGTVGLMVGGRDSIMARTSGGVGVLSGQFYFEGGTSRAYGTADTNLHLFYFESNASSQYVVEIDGVLQTGTISGAGWGSITQPSHFGRPDGSEIGNAEVYFDGLYLGSFSSAQRSDLYDWFVAHYLTPSSTQGQIKVYDGSAFVAKPVKVWNGSTWVTKPLKEWNGSAWITTPY